MPSVDLETRVFRTLADAGMFTGGETVVVGVSGGSDSMALLHLLVRLNEANGLNLRIHAAHLNHQLRSTESDADAEFVSARARALRVGCTVEASDVHGRSRKDGVSIELAARRCRYEFFERLCLKLEACMVMLAHHADDQVETVLFRILRGTGMRGLAGIRAVRPIRHGSGIRVVRPLLAVGRGELDAYVADRNIPFRIDISNESSMYARNRIRHELLPLIREQFNPQVDEALARLCEQARAVEEYLHETCTRMLESLIVEHNNRQLVLHVPSLTRRPRIIQTQLIREVVLRLGLGEGELASTHLNAVADLLAGEEGSKEIHLPGGLRVSRRYSRLVFESVGSSETTGPPEQEILVSTDGTTPLSAFGMELRIDSMDADQAMIADYLGRRADRERFCYEEWFDAERVHPPLTARPRRSGDRFFPLGSPGMKKLSDFFIDEKIDASEREKLVILCDQLGPIWIVPLRIDDRVRLTRQTRKVLRVVAGRGYEL